jgi:hypothetical protein
MNYDDMNYDGQTARHGVPSHDDGAAGQTYNRRGRRRGAPPPPHDDGAAGAADAAQDMRLQKVR